jgi:hypothetical protein
MSKIPHHIKIIYIMILQHKFAARELAEDLNGSLLDCLDCAVDICGAWEGYSQAIEERNNVMRFVQKYKS